MDKLTTISAALFMAADVCAIVSLAMPDWIVTSVGGMCEMDAPKLLFANVYQNFVRIFRRNSLGIDVDMYDTVQ